MTIDPIKSYYKITHTIEFIIQHRFKEFLYTNYVFELQGWMLLGLVIVFFITAYVLGPISFWIAGSPMPGSSESMFDGATAMLAIIIAASWIKNKFNNKKVV